MSENLYTSPEGEPATFDALYTLASMIRGARLAGRKDDVVTLRAQVQALYAGSDYHELRETYAAMCTAYRYNEDAKSDEFDSAIRSAWIDLHAYLELQYPKAVEPGGELFAINAAALQQQAATQAMIEQGDMPQQRAMPQRIEPPTHS